MRRFRKRQEKERCWQCGSLFLATQTDLEAPITEPKHCKNCKKQAILKLKSEKRGEVPDRKRDCCPNFAPRRHFAPKAIPWQGEGLKNRL